jgi:hypothetical protein
VHCQFRCIGLFLAYLTTLRVGPDDGMTRIWKESVLPQDRREGLRETMKILVKIVGVPARFEAIPVTSRAGP